jgi:hypothetical protein
MTAMRSASATRRLCSVPDAQADSPRYCSRCGQPVVVAGATFCKECGAELTTIRWLRVAPGYNPVVAAALSFVPGLGHLYRGRLTRAILWFVGVTAAYTMGFAFGVFIHIICATNAALAGAIRDDVFARARRRVRRYHVPFDSGG